MLEEPRFGWIPIGAPLNVQTTEEHSTHFDDSVNAVSLGFVATAILISMFLVMAIFERFLRPNSSDSQNHEDLEAQLGSNPKLGYPSPKVSLPCLLSNQFCFFPWNFMLVLALHVCAPFDSWEITTFKNFRKAIGGFSEDN